MAELSYQPENVRILIADDQDLIRKSVIKILKKKGFEQFIECSNGAEAIKILESRFIDLVFCDIYMPKADGYQVLSYVRNRTTADDIPFVMITGEAGKDDIVKAADKGVEDYLLKPFQSTEIERKVDHILTKYHNPTPLIFHIRSAEKLLLSGSFEEAAEQIKSALAIDAESARANHLAGIIYHKMGEIKKGIEYLQNNIRLHPRFLKNYRTLANIFLNSKKLEEALKYMRVELDLNPKDIKRQVQIANLLRKICEYPQAIDHYRFALLENSKIKPALFGMGIAHCESGNLEKGMYYFKRTRRYFSEDSKPLEAVVKYALSAKKPKMAEMILKDEKKNNPKRLDTYVILTKFYARTERHEDALNCISESLKIKSSFREGMLLKLSLEMKLGRFNDAEQTAFNLMMEHPSLDSALKQAEVYAAGGKYQEAIQTLNRTLRKTKNVGPVFLLLAISHYHTSQVTKSYFCYLKAHRSGRKSDQTIQATNGLKEIIVNRRKKPKPQAS